MNRFDPYIADATYRIENGFEQLEKIYANLMSTCPPENPETSKYITFIHNSLNQIDEYSTEITSAFSAISNLIKWFATIDELKANAPFVFYLNESINKYNEYVILYRKYDAIREPLVDKIDIA